MRKFTISCLALVASLVVSTAFAETGRLGSSTQINFNPLRVMAKSADYTLTLSDSEVDVTCSSANIVITLPDLDTVTTGTKAYKILKADATAYSVVVTPATGDTVGGESTRYIVSENGNIILESGPGNDWTVSYESPFFLEDHEAGTATFTGIASTLFTSDMTISGTTPSITVGDGGDEDTYVLFNGITDDFYIAHDAADDDLNIGYGGATEAEAGTQTAIEITDSATPGVSIVNAFAANGDTTVGNAVTDDLTITAAILGGSPFVLDGTTDDTNELTVTLGADPGADYTLTVPATSSSAVVISALTTNDVDVANSAWFVSNGLRMEGATADAYEGTLSPTDPTADQTWTLPDATGTVALRTGEVTTATDVLTAAECGKMIFLNSGTEYQTTLPALSTVPAGCQFEFITKAAAAAANYTVITGNSKEAKIYGLVEVNGAAVACAAEDTITFVDGNAIGDWAKVRSDGTNWYITGGTVTAAKLTCTDEV